MVIFFYDKNGWMRIFEVAVAILLLSSILIYVTIRNQVDIRNEQFSTRISDIQKGILEDIALSPSLRNATLSSNFSVVSDYVSSKLDNRFNYSIGICDMDSPVCSPFFPYTTIAYSGDVFVEERIISSTLESYSPKVIRLYVWVND